ncbi:MAG: ComEC/Rec2 family competence protein, partial [Oscillospiraceae bacterium]
MSQRYEWASLAEQMPESAVVVQGKIKAAYPSMGETRSYLLQTKLIGANGFPQHKNIIIYGTNDIDFHAGEWIQCDLIGFRNVPTRSQLGKGADMIGWVDFVQPQILKEASSFDKMMENLKFMLTVNLKQSVPAPYDTILIAMLLGDASEMNMTVYDRFNLTGISHVLCVSGLHITFIGGVIIALFQLIFGKRLIPDLMGLGAMIFFVVLTGSTAPAMRALVMTATMIFSKHIIRDYSPINTLGGVVFLFCAIDTAVVYNLGFLLSVLSIYAICAVAPKWMNALCRRFHVRNRFLKNGLSILCSSCAVSVFLMPIMMIFNGYTSLLAPLANLAILPIIPFSMILGAICAVIGGTSIGMFLGKVNGLLLHWIIEGVEKAGESSFALLPLNFPIVVMGMMVCFVILSLPSFGGRLRIYRKQAVGLSALVLMISIGITVQMNRQVLQITEIRTTE